MTEPFRQMFSQPERVCLWVSALGVVAAAALRLNNGLPPIWVSDFTAVSALCAVFLGAGVWLRLDRRAPRVALFLVYFALFGIFTMAMTLFNASLLPLRYPLIDHHLIAADAWLGFDWLAYVAWFQDWPALSAFLAFVYGTHLVQISLMLVTLSVLGWRGRLEEMTIAAIFGASLTIGFWAFFPSFGPSPHLPVPPDIARAVGLDVAAHAQFMMQAAAEGITTMTGENLAGLVGFPSFHVMMALLAVWYLRGTALFWPLGAFNLFMLPATVLHGAHHLMDIPGGIAGFALAAWAARAYLWRVQGVSSAQQA